MIRIAIFAAVFALTAQARAAIEPQDFLPAKVLGKYEDRNSPTKESYIIDTGTGIAVVRIPQKNGRELLTSLWGDCRGALPVKQAAKLAESEFCRAVRNPEFDQPERGLEAYTFSDPETAARNYRRNLVFFSLTLVPGFFFSDAATVTFLLPTDLKQLESRPLETEIRIYRGTTRKPELKIQKLKPL